MKSKFFFLFMIGVISLLTGCGSNAKSSANQNELSDKEFLLNEPRRPDNAPEYLPSLANGNSFDLMETNNSDSKHIVLNYSAPGEIKKVCDDQIKLFEEKGWTIKKNPYTPQGDEKSYLYFNFKKSDAIKNKDYLNASITCRPNSDQVNMQLTLDIRK